MLASVAAKHQFSNQMPENDRCEIRLDISKMKTMKNCAVNTMMTVVLLSIMMLSFPGVSLADITRHCRSFYELQYLSINGDNISHGQKIRFGNFESRGSCGNKFVANRCRERARGHAQDCMNEHWKTRWDRAKPAFCTVPKGVEGYSIQDIKGKLELTACCSPEVPAAAQSHWKDVIIALKGVTTGDKECPGVLTFSTTYTIDCTQVAAGFKACGGE